MQSRFTQALHQRAHRTHTISRARIQQYDCASSLKEVRMAVRLTQNAGMLLLSVWLILTGITGFAAFPLPAALMSALALIAGVLILVGH